jgi:homoserine dehydrogenase
MTREVRVLIAGYGTVGKALHGMVQEQSGRIAETYGVRFDVQAIARSSGAWRAAEGKSLRSEDLVIDARTDDSVLGLIEAGAADVLVELTPTDLKTGGQGLVHCRAALERGMSVVTANKGPIVLAYPELRGLAEKNEAAIRFEATAGAAIPLLNLKDFCLRGDRVTRIEGILNGTCNYILTRMGEEGLGFDQALMEAQTLGYAEADPTADVGGHDAAAKVVILGNHFFDASLTLDDVAVTGITEVTGEAVQLAMKQGFVVRLVAAVDDTGHAVVAPRLVPIASPLNVPGTLNVVRMYAENAGPIAVSGRGAGGKETAAAVLSDLITVAAGLR